MNKQQKRKNQKKHRDNIYKAFMEGVRAASPKSLNEMGRAKTPTSDVFTGKRIDKNKYRGRL